MLIVNILSGCTNLTYDPLEFSIGITMLLDNQAIFMNKISGNVD